MEDGRLFVPSLAAEGLKALKNESPSITKTLSWRHIDLLTKPYRDKISELESLIIPAGEVSMKLRDHINQHHGGSQRAFACSQAVLPPQVSQWITKGFIVVDHILYSPRRELNSM